MQEFNLDKNIILIDSPGVVLSTKDQTDSLILRSAIKIEEITDPIRPIEAMLARIPKEDLIKYYRIADYKTTDEFLGQVARKKGHLHAGGVANMDQAARSILRDF
jgi:nuclear GTP-binding protein